MGSEFKDQFEEAYKNQKINLYLNWPRSPKHNGHIERANRTHREEFYEGVGVDLDLESHNRQLEDWAYMFTHIRPDQALGYLTPYQAYLLWKRSNKEV